jgi:hypothetical protein
MEIPKTASVAADDDRPSFLTLPGEVRNMVYGFLYERDGPVLIHNVRAYYAPEPTLPEDQGDDVGNVDAPNSDPGIGHSDEVWNFVPMAAKKAILATKSAVI